MLAALVAAAIPVILHLLNLQKVEKMEFSSIMLIKEIRKSRFRKLRIRQFLLMLIRLLTIVFLVLAFAGPYFRDISGKGSGMRKTGLIIIDTSYSVNAVNNSPGFKETAERTVGNIISLFSSSDNVVKQYAYVSTGDSSVPEHRPDLNSIIRTAGEQNPGNVPDEVYVVTDMQKINFEDNPDIASGKLSDTRFYFLDVSSPVTGNVSVNNVFVETRIPNPGNTIRLRTAVKNDGAGTVSGIRLKLFAGGMLKSETLIDLKPGERKETELEFIPDNTGLVTCRTEIGGMSPNDNALKEDDSFSFGIFIPEKINIGILKGSSADTRYITAVFDAANAKFGTAGRVYDYTQITSASYISKYDALFIAGYDSKSPADYDSLKSFLDKGKGVFVFPSDNYSGELLKKTGSVIFGGKTAAGKELKLSGIRPYEPLFEGMFRGKSGTDDISQPVRVSAIYEIMAGSNAYPLLSAASIPLLVLDRTNYGAVIVSSLPADETMSDFVKNEIFAPLVLRSAVYLSFNGLYQNKNSNFINHDTLESVTAKAGGDFLKDVLGKSGIKNYDVIGGSDAGNLEMIVNGNRKGKSVWIYAVIVALLLVVSELLAVRKLYRNRD